MRAHMALKYSGLTVELREVSLKSYPEEARRISAKATVPVLQLSDGTVLDESWNIVKWALQKNDPDNWMGPDNAHLIDAEMLVETNDFSFKEDLDHYKYADRFPEYSAEYYRQACEEFIEELEDMLSENSFLLSERISLPDISVFPFVRQFSIVDKSWFEQAPYPNVQYWLNTLTSSSLFESVFQKHDIWKEGDGVILL
jgi:glutathione S-transferase